MHLGVHQFHGAFSYESPSWADTVTGDTVGIINISGHIQYDGTTSSPEGLKSQLDAAEQNPHIKAVVLRVNSGGGVATAGEEMSTYIRDFSKPVVVSSASINASAAYMISSQADYIFTDKTTSIGSIGVIMSVTDLSGLYEKLGISVENITSADAKDSGAGNRPLTEEERAWYQDQVDQINEVFINFVAEGRDMPVEDVRALGHGPYVHRAWTPWKTGWPTSWAPKRPPWRRPASWPVSPMLIPCICSRPRAICRAFWISWAPKIRWMFPGH